MENSQNLQENSASNGLEKWTEPGFIERTARLHGGYDILNPHNTKNVIDAASRVQFENLPPEELPVGASGKMVEGALRVETVIQNASLPSKQLEFARGLKENFLGASAFISELGDKLKKAVPEKGKVVGKVATSLLVVQMALSACNPVNSPKPSEAGFTETPVPSETFTPTPTPTETATPEPTPTKESASETWQLSPDGHVYYNESKLYNGLFTINKEHPEWVEQYWEENIRGLWHLNDLFQNKSLTSRFPTSDSLIKYLKNGGGPISNFMIPINYPPDKLHQTASRGNVKTMALLKEPVDLSIIALNIDDMTKEEKYNLCEIDPCANGFLSFLDASYQIKIQEISIQGRNILQLTFRNGLLMDDPKEYPDIIGGTSYQRLALSDDKNPQDNLAAASQLIRAWPLVMFSTHDYPANGAVATSVTPHILSMYIFDITTNEFYTIAKPEGSPISVR